MRIQDLTTIAGADRLRLALGLDQDQVDKIKIIAQSMAGNNPHIKDTYVGKSSPNVSFYDYKNNRLGIGHKSTDVLAHEMGHAASLANSSDFYKSILRGSKRLANLSNNLAIPISTFIGLNPKLDTSQKEEILGNAALLSGALAVPNIFEELNASGKAIYHSPTKFRTAVSMVPGIISHSLNDFTAPSTYILAKKLIGAHNND